MLYKRIHEKQQKHNNSYDNCTSFDILGINKPNVIRPKSRVCQE